MSSFLYCVLNHYFVIYSILISLSSSQNTICVWNAINRFDVFNGEYTISSDLSYGKPYWSKSSITCPSNTYYMMYVNDEWGDWWMLDDKLGTSYNDGHPYCEEQTPSDPTGCTAGWYDWTNNKAVSLPITVTDGPCPSLQCNNIRLSNTNNVECDAIFSRDITRNNIFVNGNTYLYFNKNTFKWYCSSILANEECGDDADITHFYVSSQHDGWKDINIGQSFQGQLNNGYTATFECIGPTASSTIDPTQLPTPSPTMQPTPTPTSKPTDNPTPAPTNNPTPSPTDTTDITYTASPTTSTQIVSINKLVAKEAAEGAADVDTTTTEILIVDEEQDEFENESGSTDNNYVYVMIAVVASFCLSVCCVVFTFYVKRIHKNKKAVDALSKVPNVSLMNIPTDTGNDNETPSSIAMTSMASTTSMISMPGSPPAILSSLSMIANLDFQANLTNLTGANNILMDDIVVDMEGNTTTAGPDDVDLDNLDMTESINEQNNNDETDKADDLIIDGNETIGDNNNYEKEQENEDCIFPPSPAMKGHKYSEGSNMNNYGSPKTYDSTFVDLAVMDDIIIDLETDTIQ